MFHSFIFNILFVSCIHKKLIKEISTALFLTLSESHHEFSFSVCLQNFELQTSQL